MENDPSVPEGWKIKYIKRTSGKFHCDKLYYPPGQNILIRSQIGMKEYIEYMKNDEEKRALVKKLEEERQKELEKTEISKMGSLESDLPDYFKNHPSLIHRWAGEEATLLEDSNISGGWKIKLKMRKDGRHRKHFVTPEYLQHNDVQHGGDIESLLETLLLMKSSKYKIKLPSNLQTETPEIHKNTSCGKLISKKSESSNAMQTLKRKPARKNDQQSPESR